jgi:hypothetical protein
MVVIPLNSLTSPLVYVCPKLRTSFQTASSVVISVVDWRLLLFSFSFEIKQHICRRIPTLLSIRLDVPEVVLT